MRVNPDNMNNPTCTSKTTKNLVCVPGALQIMKFRLPLSSDFTSIGDCSVGWKLIADEAQWNKSQKTQSLKK